VRDASLSAILARYLPDVDAARRQDIDTPLIRCPSFHDNIDVAITRHRLILVTPVDTLRHARYRLMPHATFGEAMV